MIPKNIKKGTKKQKAQKSTTLRKELRQKENNKKTDKPKIKKRIVAISTLKKLKKCAVRLEKFNVDEPTNAREFIIPRPPL